MGVMIIAFTILTMVGIVGILSCPEGVAAESD